MPQLFANPNLKKIGVLLLLTLVLTGCASTAPRDTDVRIQRLLAHYNQWHGTPYRHGGNGRGGVDCSAFVQLTYRSVFRLGLPRETSDQANTGKRIKRSRLQSGDLVFFKTGWRKRHVGIYLGNNEFIHASESQGVTRSSLTTPYWSKNYWKARRINLPI